MGRRNLTASSDPMCDAVVRTLLWRVMILMVQIDVPYDARRIDFVAQANLQC